jgi:hypothetical protein
MSLRFPKRYGIQTMFVCVAVIATTIFLCREHVQLNDARENFEFVWASWQFQQVRDENLVLASETLMRAESASSWISTHTAQLEHLRRLERMLKAVDSPVNENSPERWQQRHNYVQEQIMRYSRSTAD